MLSKHSRSRRNPLTAILVGLAGLSFLPINADPLATAKSLAANRFGGKDYSQVNCVQFVLAVVQEETQMTLGADARKAVLVDHGWSAEETQAIAKEGTDKRLAGVQYALTSILKRGTIVKPEDARPGDLIQYWMRRADGTWFGHAGIISAVQNHRATIFGSHESQNGIGDSTWTLNLTGSERHIYIVRMAK